MRFALLDDHPDGIELADALEASGRHQVVACTTTGRQESRRSPVVVADVEEVLADPAVEAVIVAGSPSVRPAQLRRALQSERHVLCVYPPDETPEIAYEAAMLQNDTGCVLLPILPEATHPAIRRLAEFVQRSGATAPSSPVGSFRLLEVERAVPGEVLDGIQVPGQKPSSPGWDVLRAVGGEIQEVSAFAEREELIEGEPVLVCGRFERGGLFQMTLLPRQPPLTPNPSPPGGGEGSPILPSPPPGGEGLGVRGASWRLTLIGTAGRVELFFPLGWQGPACLSYRDDNGEPHEEYWERWDPWPTLIEAFEEALRPGGRPSLSWQDAVRALELDDAARRSVERRRSSVLEYPEATEEVGFKGTMTLAGCGLIWAVLLLFILSRWWPKLGWFIVPLLLVFMVLQLLRFFIPRGSK